MENNIFNINGFYVGEVKEANPLTHELEVYVPQLTPTLNYGFSPTTYTTGLQTSVTKTNTILCKPYDFKALVPTVGSLVRVMFIGGDIKRVYWLDFDPFGENIYTPFEKTRSERILDDITKMFDTVMEEGNKTLVPEDHFVNIGTENNPIRSIHGWLNIEYIVGINKVIEDINNSIKSVSDELVETVKDIDDIDNDISDLSLALTTWSDSGRRRDSGNVNNPQGDIIWIKSISINSFTGTPGEVGTLFTNSWELEKFSNTILYFDAKGSYQYGTNSYNLGNSYIIDTDKVLYSGIVLKDNNTILFELTSGTNTQPTSAELIIEVTTSNNKPPKTI